jgi:hypothetical protein
MRPFDVLIVGKGAAEMCPASPGRHVASVDPREVVAWRITPHRILHLTLTNGNVLRARAIVPATSAHVGGDGPSLAAWLRDKGGRLARRDLATLRSSYPALRWVLLRDPKTKEMLVLDVTAWMYAHPGGSWPFEGALYRDITRAFEEQVSHKRPDGSWHPRVLAAVRKYRLATLV